MTSLPLQPNNAMLNAFKELAKEVYFVGDCSDPKLIAEATSTGSLIAHKI
jgi:hypothetical protein